MRDYELKDNRVTYYTLEPFKNHGATCYKRVVRGAHLCKYEWAKRLRGWVWFLTGYAI